MCFSFLAILFYYILVLVIYYFSLKLKNEKCFLGNWAKSLSVVNTFQLMIIVF